jgi:hypothetical protein
LKFCRQNIPQVFTSALLFTARHIQREDFGMDNSGTKGKMTIKNAQNDSTIQDDKLVMISG